MQNLALALALLAMSAAGGDFAKPDRSVTKNVVTSEHDPKVQIEVPASAVYVGADRWPLYDVADCEIEVFVEAKQDKTVHKLYWIQFEGYLPDNNYRHTYDSPRHVTIGGLDFFVDTWARADGAETRKGSDREHVEALVKAKGFKMPAGMAYVRLVHLLDVSTRKELMIIYGEDLAPSGYTAADLDEKGKSRDKWAEIEKGVIQRAQERVRITPKS